jgi:hypothetical protein
MKSKKIFSIVAVAAIIAVAAVNLNISYQSSKNLVANYSLNNEALAKEGVEIICSTLY